MASVHVFAGIFAVTFAGTMAVFFRRKLTAMLVTVAALGARPR